MRRMLPMSIIRIGTPRSRHLVPKRGSAVGVGPPVDAGSPSILLSQGKEGGIWIIGEPAVLRFVLVPEVPINRATNLINAAAQEQRRNDAVSEEPNRVQVAKRDALGT